MALGPNLLPCDGEVLLDSGWLPAPEADALFEKLLASLDWQQEEARFGTKPVPLPRLTAWYGDVGYRYSGVSHAPRPWPAHLAELRERVWQSFPGPGGVPGQKPNSVLANLYRDGQDSVGWHSDDEPSLGEAPTIWSLSLGATRRFLLRHRATGKKLALDLPHGSLLVMAGGSQRCWQHCLPKTASPVGRRVNLTFRCTAAESPNRRRQGA
jgi:alkylated DNA repair dioxygenase AlkB